MKTGRLILIGMVIMAIFITCRKENVSTSKSKDANETIEHIYSCANSGNYADIVVYFLPDTLDNLSESEKTHFNELMTGVMPEAPIYLSYSIEEMNQKGDTARFMVKTSFKDGLTYKEEGILVRNDEDEWNLFLIPEFGSKIETYKVEDETKKSPELLRNLTYAFNVVMAVREIPEFQLRAAYNYEDSVFTVPDLNKYFSLVKSAAEKNYFPALVELGHAFRYGKGVSRDATKGFEYYKKAADFDYPRAISFVGECFLDGIGVKQNYSEAKKWYEKGVDLGDSDSMNDLAVMYYEGKGVPINYKKTIELYEKAIALGNYAAMYNLAGCYYWGDGVKKDMVKAIELFQKAAENGNSWALDELGNIYYKGANGISSDYSKAYQYYKKNADLGVKNGLKLDLKESSVIERVSNSAYMAGECLRLGRGTSQNKPEALKYYKIAADLGRKDAKNMIKNL